MRKLILALSLIACFLASYGLGRFLRNFSLSPRSAQFSEALPQEPNRETHAVNANPHPRFQPPVPAKPNAAPAKDIAEAVAKDKGAGLFPSLRRIPRTPYNRLHEALRRRFAEEYPKQERDFLKEAASRIGLLSSLAGYKNRALTQAEQQQLLTFLEDVAQNTNEANAVRESAARTQLQFLGRLEEDERNEMLARMPASLIDRASRPAHELVEEIFRWEAP